VIKALLSFLGRTTSGLYDFESLAIEEVITHLGNAGPQVRRQIEVVNRVQRIAGGKEVDLYCMRAGKVAFDDRLRFPGIDEARLATVILHEGTPGRHKLKLELWLANGRLFSLIYDRPPQEFFGASRLRDVRPSIADVRIETDPLQIGGPRVRS